MTRRLLSALAAALMAVPAVAQEVTHYGIVGSNPDGQQYIGTARITPTGEATCEIHWIVADAPSSGICVRRETAIAAAYTLDDRQGVTVYEIMADGTLKGTWTIDGFGGVGTEVLTPAP
jgi:hypothetical protein